METNSSWKGESPGTQPVFRLWSGAGLAARCLVGYIRGPSHPAKIRLVRYLQRCVFRLGIPLRADNGALLAVSAADFIGWKLLVEGAYEPLTLQLARKLLGSGGTLLDVGANIGLFSAYLCVEPKVTALCVEAHPGNFQRLERTVALNNIDTQCELVQCAAADQQGELVLEEVEAENSGLHRVAADNRDSANRVHRVAAHRLDDLLEQSCLERVTVLKIDVEGFEIQALKGMSWEGRYRPKNVITEFSDYSMRLGGAGKQEMVSFFKDQGYTGYLIDGRKLEDQSSIPEDNVWFSDDRSPVHFE